MSKASPLENVNTRIWDKVCETDPSRTKAFNKGYRGTSINPNYIYEKLTSVFGPCGLGWGVRVVNEAYIKGHGEEQSHTIQIEFWYKSGDVKSDAIPGFGCTQYVFKDKNGYHSDEDAPKKSLTDALTKATQLIGMSADIFGGQWDDCKYVAELKKKYSGSDDSKPEQETPTQKAIENVLKNHAPQTIGTPDTGEKKVTKAQAGLIYHKLTESGLDDDEKKRWYEYHYGVDSNYRLPIAAVKTILDMFQEGSIEPVPAEAGERAEDGFVY